MHANPMLYVGRAQALTENYDPVNNTIGRIDFSKKNFFCFPQTEIFFFTLNFAKICICAFTFFLFLKKNCFSSSLLVGGWLVAVDAINKSDTKQQQDLTNHTDQDTNAAARLALTSVGKIFPHRLTEIENLRFHLEAVDSPDSVLEGEIFAMAMTMAATSKLLQKPISTHFAFTGGLREDSKEQFTGVYGLYHKLQAAIHNVCFTVFYPTFNPDQAMEEIRIEQRTAIALSPAFCVNELIEIVFNLQK